VPAGVCVDWLVRIAHDVLSGHAQAVSLAAPPAGEGSPMLRLHRTSGIQEEGEQ
jgi:hypothetical protein